VALAALGACAGDPVGPTRVRRPAESPGDSVASARVAPDLRRFGGTAPAVFETMPVTPAQVTGIRPLGALRAPEGGLPSVDATVLVRGDGGARTTVFAVADALVIGVDARERVVELRVRDDVRVRYAGVIPDATLRVGQVLSSGAPLGVLAVAAEGLALRVTDVAVVRDGWIAPQRYGARRHAAFFVSYLAEAIRPAAWALVRRAAPDLAGRVAYDRDGFLVGTWFDPSLAPDAGSLPAGDEPADPAPVLAPRSVTLAYDAERPGEVRIAIGGAVGAALGVSGVFAVAWEDPDPATVSVASGERRYRLYPEAAATRIGAPVAELAVRLLDDRTVRLSVHREGGAAPRTVTLIR
jgi:hypothetical protein